MPLTLSEAAAGLAETQDPELSRLLVLADEFGQARGWSEATCRRVRLALRVLVAVHGVEGVDRHAVEGLRLVKLPPRKVVEFLAAQGLVDVDPEVPLEQWLGRRLDPLPAAVRSEVWVWVDVLRGRTPRRGRPHDAATIKAYVSVLRPSLAAWSARFESLRQVTAEDVRAELEGREGSVRRLAVSAMRSLFRTLKAQRLLFADPTVRLSPGRSAAPPVLPLALRGRRPAGTPQVRSRGPVIG